MCRNAKMTCDTSFESWETQPLNFVLRKCKCSLGNSRGLLKKSGYHAENPWKTRHFYFDALFGYHKVSWWYPKFSQEKFDTSALKWRVARVFWIARTEIISKNKRTPLKVSGLYIAKNLITFFIAKQFLLKETIL